MGTMLPDRSIVIGGLSGKWPKSANVSAFWENLMDGVDMIEEEADPKWNCELLGLPSRTGRIEGQERFDAEYFGVHEKLGNSMDPRLRMTLELTHEAIIDAGFNPQTLRGSRTGVFVGASGEEGRILWRNSNESKYLPLGTYGSMLANRTSFTFDFKGPSSFVDTACSSSFTALHEAVLNIRSGVCDSAVVVGASLLLDSDVSVRFNKLRMLSPDGRCKSFDAAANGYVRSEAIVVIFICKEGMARRSYGRILHVKSNADGYKEQGVTFPSGLAQEQLMRETYAEAGVDPNEVEYVEAHGTGTAAGDPQEVEAIGRVFCEKRQENFPLLLGSVKSNMGHCEAASGLCSLAKVVLAAQAGILPSNLHYNSPNPALTSITSGRINVVNRNMCWNGGVVGINNFGFGGANVHVIVETCCNPIVGNSSLSYTQELPFIIPYSGRTSKAVDHMLRAEEDIVRAYLLRYIQEQPLPGHGFRGYSIPSTGILEIRDVPKTAPPVWFVCSGMGSQWKGMGLDLLQFPVFRKTIEALDAVLQTRGTDLMGCIVDDKNVKDKFSSSVAITGIQIALVDLVKSLGITPDGCFGHSTGEMVCSYIDGCYTAEEVALLVWARSTAISDSNPEQGAMASIGLSWEELQARCPEGITLACHNAMDNVSIAGTESCVRSFVEKMEMEGVFARFIDSSGFAFHSPLMTPVEPTLRQYLKAANVRTASRSSKWISSTIPQDWTNDSKEVSIDYWVNNLLNPVLFYDALQQVPSNSVVIEVAPHGVLQAILKRALPTCTVLSLNNKTKSNNAEFFVDAVGKMFIAGLEPQMTKLYAELDFPLSGPSTRNANISSLIKWDHSQTWDVPIALGADSGSVTEVNLNASPDAYYSGHKIDGRILFPATGYLNLVWKALAQKRNAGLNQAVVFENVELKRATILSENGSAARFSINVHENGIFEVVEGGATVATGVAHLEAVEQFGCPDLSKAESFGKGDLVLKESDAYKELRLRGYEYSGDFQGIAKVDSDGKWATVRWGNNWTTFLDNMLQLECFSSPYRSLALPTWIERVSIQPRLFLDVIKNNGREYEIPVFRNDKLKLVQCDGVEIRGIHLTTTKKKGGESPTLEGIRFAAFMDNPHETTPLEQALGFCVGVVAENLPFRDVAENKVAIVSPEGSDLVSVISDLVSKEMTFIGAFVPNSNLERVSVPVDRLVLLVLIQSVPTEIPSASFLLYIGEGIPSELRHLPVIVSKNTETTKIFLLGQAINNPTPRQVIKLSPDDFSWVEELQSVLKKGAKVDLVSNSGSSSGILGFLRCLIKEPGNHNNVRCYFYKDNCDYETLQRPLLNFNVYHSGRWGSYYSYNIEDLLNNPGDQQLESNVNVVSPGDLSSLRWTQSPKGKNTEENVKVSHAALNFRDVMLATGKLSTDVIPGMRGQECPLGMEYSGISATGQRVMGIVQAKALATSVKSDPILTWKVPEMWTLADAATVPVVYATAYYALVVRGNMRQGESVLIHSGAGGVGQAAIGIALSMNCRIFTTVGSEDKRSYLKQRFPMLTDGSFANSRSYTDFERHIMENTNGRGVNLVLNSLAGEMLQASVRCLAEYGRFLEIGKFDLSNNTALGMSIFLKSISFHGILLDAMMQGTNEDKTRVAQLVKEGIDAGVVKPLMSTVYAHSELESAFRYLASGKHIGKVLVNVGSTSAPASYSRTYFEPNKSYIIVGALGGFGMELVNWMVERDAGKLVLVSRSGVTNSYQEYRLKHWRESGNCQIIITQENVATLEGATNVLLAAKELGPIGGIFNLAMILRDGLFQSQTKENFELVSAPKVRATTHLDKLSRLLAPQLDHFVVFSSVVSGKGNAGQSNYAYANSFMEQICEQRREEGYPGLAIQWGAIGDVGVVHDKMGGNDVVIAGSVPQRLSSCLATLDLLLQQNEFSTVSSCVYNAKRDDDSSNTGSASQRTLAQKVGHILGIRNVDKVRPSNTLIEMGMDSLMASEIHQLLERDKITVDAIGRLPFSYFLNLNSQ